LAWLNSKRIFCWPNASIGVWDPVRKIFRKPNSKFHRNGVSDILGIYKEKPLAIECKAKNGKLSPEQKTFLSMFEAFGGIAICARSIDDVESVLNKL